jgi:hypothetical protein
VTQLLSSLGTRSSKYQISVAYIRMYNAWLLPTGSFVATEGQKSKGGFPGSNLKLGLAADKGMDGWLAGWHLL